MNEDYLEHHGILGQRWGIRRYQNPDGTLTEKGKKKLRKQSQEINKKETKDLSEISDEELKRYINRLKDENTFQELYTKRYGDKKSETRQELSRLGKQASSQILSMTISSVGSELGKMAIKKIPELFLHSQYKWVL